MTFPTFILTVSGSDSSGCAGMQADNRAIHAAGAQPLNVLTAVTLQTPDGLLETQSMPPAFVGRQVRELLKAYPVAAIKSGMLVSAAHVRELARVLLEFPDIPYVLDPVCRSSGGGALLDSEGIALLRETLLTRTTLITPNLEEVFALAEGDEQTDAPQTAARLSRKSGVTVLLKGGHADGPTSDDQLYRPEREPVVFSTSRIQSRNTRGTGCALSAAIAARLALGDELEEAIRKAKALLQHAMCEQTAVQWPGQGPAFNGYPPLVSVKGRPVLGEGRKTWRVDEIKLAAT